MDRLASANQRSFANARYIDSPADDVPGASCDGLAYREAGAGPPILLAHDVGTDSRVWGEQVADLAAHHRLVALDQRGAGKSPRPAGKFDPAEDLRCAVTQLGLEQPVLMGVGDGGEHTLQVAVAGRVDISGLVLVAPALPWALQNIAPQEWLEDIDESLDLVLSDMESAGISAAIETRDFTTLAQLNADHGGGLTEGHPSRDLLYEMVLSNMESMLESSEFALPGQQYEAGRLELVATPTLVIANTAPRAGRWAALLADHMPNCTVRLANTPATLVNLESPRLFNEMVLPFIEEVAG